MCLVLAGLTWGCQSARELCASAIVYAPNRGVAEPGPVAGETRVVVGPPRASLAIEILDTPAPRGTVFVLHGVRADRRSTIVWGKMLAAAGFRAVLVDLRGHGRSTGDWLSFGVVESRDLVQTLDLLESRGLRVGGVGVLGMSYGAGTAIEWAGIDPRVKAVVAVAPFASLRDVVPGYLFMFPRSLVSSAIDLAGRRAGFDPDDASPVRAIARTEAHVLLIHGLDDRRIPPWHSVHLFEARREGTELLLIPGADHGSIDHDPSVQERAPEWFATYLDSPSPPSPPPPAAAPSGSIRSE